MGRFLLKTSVVGAIVALGAAACSSSSAPGGPASSASEKAAAIPSATTVTEPVTYGFYDGHVDTMLSTDVSSKSQARSRHINYSAALLTRPARTFPALYMVMGRSAAHQPLVFGSEPGESDYSPLWDETIVKWKAGAKPVLLVKDDQIKALAAAGKLTVTSTPVVLNCPIVKVG